MSNTTIASSFGLRVAAILGASAVALGAFGAHGLKAWLAEDVDGPQRLAWWTTGAHYQLVHAALAAVLGVVLLTTSSPSPWLRRGVLLCIAGTVLFSGSLYAMTITNIRVLGAVTPLGGASFIAAWLSLLGARR
jgi:uncharacterized membrane protein YgdD (TMEM256/DUF423 family)